jgi:uncharacterized protein YoxC
MKHRQLAKNQAEKKDGPAAIGLEITVAARRWRSDHASRGAASAGFRGCKSVHNYCMADRPARGGQERNRIKTLTQAALNADKTVEQVEDVLDGLSSTMKELSSSLSALNATVERLEKGLDHLDGTMTSLDELAKRLIVLVEPVETIVARIDDMVKVGETMLSPLSVTEHAVRGLVDRLRNRTGP